jgi:hypothetical protein
MNENEQKEEIIKILPMLQEIMSEEDYNKMREDFHNGNDNSVPFWKFLFENVEVKYTR